jgi:hypothetical protein
VAGRTSTGSAKNDEHGEEEALADLQEWIEARKRFHLSHAHVQMGRELGLNPRKLGKIDNHDQERWKLRYRSSSSTGT